MSASRASARLSLPRASLRETFAFLSGVVLPLLGKGVILRRPPAVALAQRLNLDKRALRIVQRLRDRHGPGPLLLPVPLHPYALILSAEHAARILAASPTPFTPASDEKRAALNHFEPHGVLISGERERALRRPFNEAVLETPNPLHHLAPRFLAVVEEEAPALAKEAEAAGKLDWDSFAMAWWRMARRVMFGDEARDDHALTDMLSRLRADANWAFLFPRRRRLRRRFDERLGVHLVRAEPGSIAEVMARMPARPGTDPLHQVPQWLFALDGPARATFRTLALLGTHPAQRARAMEEIASGGPELPYLRACLLDTLRLWPTTPVILRQATEDVDWEDRTIARGTGIIIYAPFLHRDAERLPQADRFAPDPWLEGTPERAGLVPFSDGPARCPGRHLSLMLSSAMLAALLRRGFVPKGLEGIGPDRPLPATLSAYGLRFSPG
ncbi:cytochrome P450 [Pararoseomonas indoligenes]|uniref:Cytochrome P450 n=1 Tax=Roseomonas indoligenes TaxID=2820811 RepID=A0A940MW87_9PROT|nr:cytochrome P450 [Pararoseomonas indoligenes]MBP0492362.1 cytochrome P450 [Pararoseomonas indoligenes]